MPPRIPLHPTLVRAAAPGAVSAVRPISSSSVRRAVPVNEDDPDGLNVDKDKEAADEFKTWLKGPGQNFKKPLYNEMNYVSSYDFKTWQRKGVDKDRMNNPFSLNPAFRSFPVLSDTLREAIYTRVVKKGRTVRSVSAELNVNMDRVAAVVRLKSIEKTWIEQV